METVIETIQRGSTISFPGLFGDWSIDPPASFTLFGRNIYFYGVIIAVGFLLGITYCAKNAKRFGIREDDVYDLVLWLIPLSIIGARLYFVAFKREYYLAHPDEIAAIWNGGLAIYGGVIAGVAVILLVCRHKKIPWQAMLDLIIFGLLIGQILGRWGNFMNREAFGSQTDIFCRMQLTAPDGSSICVHPTFLYESLWNLVGFIGLVVWERRGGRRYDGQAALGYFFWYGVGRAWIEGLRTDSLYIGGSSLRVSQLLSIALAAITLILLIIHARKKHPPEDLYVNRVAAAAEAIAETAEKSEKTEENEHE
ncbi:MAG: prolipoprotein diacylglyceryl transferase [Oscillospiraceae bacterium]|nr:prolipoprotein diacylglyceryl transferase [Oscillospiraceae bacterium]